MTHISEYILSVLNTYGDYDGNNIDHISEQFLQFLVYEPLSAYRIKSDYMKSRNQNIDYKGVHKRMKKLLTHKLIQKVDDMNVPEDKRSVHRAIFYKLSHPGVYHIVSRFMRPLDKYETPAILFKKLLMNYKDDPLFHIILYPYFNMETVIGMDPSIQFNAILKYCYSCCEAIQDNMRTKKIGQGGGTPLFRWNYISPGQKYLFKDVENKFAILRDFLEREYHLDWLKRSEVAKFEDDNTLKISHRANSVLIKLDEGRTKANLIINRRRARKLNVTKYANSSIDMVFLPVMPIKQFAATFLKYQLKQLASELVFAVTAVPFTEKSRTLLAKDDKFTNLVKETKNEFNKRSKDILGD